MNSPAPSLKRLDITFDTLFVLTLILLASAAFGFSYGVSNHNTYLIQSLTLLDPSFLKGDWFAREVQHYHPTFSYVVLALNWLGSVEWGLAILNFLIIALSFEVIRRIIMLINKTQAFSIFACVVVIQILDLTRSVGWSYIHSIVLQPSTFAALFTLLAMRSFYLGSYWVSGIYLAVAGFFHTNFLVLSFPFFGLAHLILGRDKFFVRVVQQHTLAFILFIIKLPFLLEVGQGEGAAEAREIFLYIRSPHHYITLSYLPKLIPFIGWGLVGAACLRYLVLEKEMKRRFTALYFSFGVLLLIATCLTTVVFIPHISQLFFWRMVPFFVLIAQVFAVALLFSPDTKSEGQSRRGEFALIALGGALVTYSQLSIHGASSANFLFNLSIIGALLGRLVGPVLGVSKLVELGRVFNILATPSVRVKYVLGCIALCLLIFPVQKGIGKSSLLGGYFSRDELALFEWARSTEPDARFLIPPDMDCFRIKGQRAVVADWKSTPIDPQGLLGWYDRIENIAGKKGVKSLDEAISAYSELEVDDVLKLKNIYDVKYFVYEKNENSSAQLEKFKSVNTSQIKLAYENKRFAVWQI